MITLYLTLGEARPLPEPLSSDSDVVYVWPDLPAVPRVGDVVAVESDVDTLKGPQFDRYRILELCWCRRSIGASAGGFILPGGGSYASAGSTTMTQVVASVELIDEVAVTPDGYSSETEDGNGDPSTPDLAAHPTPNALDDEIWELERQVRALYDSGSFSRADHDQLVAKIAVKKGIRQGIKLGTLPSPRPRRWMQTAMDRSEIKQKKTQSGTMASALGVNLEGDVT